MIWTACMAIDFASLEALRTYHPAWRLLCSDHAPLVASFLNKVFLLANVRVMAAVDLAEALEDELYVLRERLGVEAFPKTAMDYLNDWGSAEKGWLRKFYRHGSAEPQFDLMPATEKAITWLGTLSERSFVGTESRLLTLFELLKQMSEGSETDPAKRVAELHKRRDEIDTEIARVLAGDAPLLDATALKDRFQQFTQLGRELLSDFREVEYNFRLLDRRVRERITLWAGAKGELLEQIMGERDAIADSDQGRSFRAFWDFLMSSRRQEELSWLLARVLSLSPIEELKPDARTRRIHYDWLEAGEHTQRTVAQLSQQLRHFLDDKAWLKNRRIMDILHSIENKALALRDHPPAGEIIHIDDTAATVELPLERPLYTPPIKPLIAELQLETGDTTVNVDALYAQVVIDKTQLIQQIRQALQQQTQITLHDLTLKHPLRQGLTELVAYLQLGVKLFKTVVNEDIIEPIAWSSKGADGIVSHRRARLPRVIFVR
jgi:hypothetical protein